MSQNRHFKILKSAPEGIVALFFLVTYLLLPHLVIQTIFHSFAKTLFIKSYENNQNYCYFSITSNPTNENIFIIWGMKEENKEDIKLDGRTEDEDKKSLTLPFGAYQVDNQEVCIISYDAYPIATIRILDISGQKIDHCTSELSPLQTVSFDISSYSGGTYTLVITTPQGIYLTGVFEVN